MDDSVEISQKDLTDIVHTVDELIMFLEDIPRMIQENRENEVSFYSGEHVIKLNEVLNRIDSDYDVNSISEEKFYENLEEQFLNG